MADELLGYRGNGIGTTTAFLAVGLARLGHDVEVLYLGPARETVVPEWRGLYERAGVTVRPLPRAREHVEPPHFVRPRQVELALRADPPDVVIAQDLGAPAYCAVRQKRLGLGFEETSFVVLCHGTRQWIADATRKIRVLPGALATSVLERAAIELADVVVSPSAYMVGWMEAQGWRLPEHTQVIPHPTRSAATGEPAPKPPARGERVERLVFFGRLEERKGLQPFVAAVNALDPELLATVELEFLGRTTPAWPTERVEALLSEAAKAALRRLTFEAELDQHEVIRRLVRPGTLVVMPSLEDNSPNAVYECLELGVPFLLSDVGGAHELVAWEERARVLFEPAPDGIAAALRRVLTGEDGLRPVRPAHEPSESLERWSEVVAIGSEPFARRTSTPSVDVVVVHRGSQDALARCLSALERQTYRGWRATLALAGPRVEPPAVGGGRIVRSEESSVEAARAAAVPELESEWVVFLDEDDVPEPELLATLVRAQQVAEADVVTCGITIAPGHGGPTLHFFPGQPRGLAVVANGYGNTALVRRSLLDELETLWPVEGDADWPLMAQLDVAGARIVSVPAPLVTRSQPPGAIERHPADALLVIEYVERSLPPPVAAAARLAGGLAGSMLRPPAVAPASLARRAARVVRDEGVRELGRRALRRLRQVPT